MNREQFSFPVGKVDMKTLYPMDMEEFLMAMGENELISAIKKSFEENIPMPFVLHEAAMEYYRKYLIVGGMPECVSKFKRDRKLSTYSSHTGYDFIKLFKRYEQI